MQPLYLRGSVLSLDFYVFLCFCLIVVLSLSLYLMIMFIYLVFSTCLSSFIDLVSVEHILVSSVSFVVSMIRNQLYSFASMVCYIIFLILNGNMEMRNSRFH